MRIYRVKSVDEVIQISDVFPSLHYRQWGVSDYESYLIESHSWGDVVRWSNRVFQTCSKCDTEIGITTKSNMFVLLYLCQPRKQDIVQVFTCNESLVKDIIE